MMPHSFVGQKGKGVVVASNPPPGFHREIGVSLNLLEEEEFSLMRNTCIRLHVHNRHFTNNLHSNSVSWLFS